MIAGVWWVYRRVLEKRKIRGGLVLAVSALRVNYNRILKWGKEQLSCRLACVRDLGPRGGESPRILLAKQGVYGTCERSPAIELLLYVGGNLLSCVRRARWGWGEPNLLSFFRVNCWCC